MKKMIEVVLVLAVLGVLTSCQTGKKEISQEATRSMIGTASGESKADTAAAGGESKAGTAAAGGESKANKAAGKSAVDTAAGKKAAAVEEEDPAAHWARNWEEYMDMPSEEQMEASNGRERSPYVAFWVKYPDVDKAIEYCVDVHTDHDPITTYYCPMNWITDVSSLEEQYESVYNDFADSIGGYCGFQRLEDGSKVFIMTLWDIFCKDSDGNVGVIAPEVIYPEDGGKAALEGDAEGSYVQCIVPFDWRPGRDYRILLQQSDSDTTGNAVFTTWICDLAENKWVEMASFDSGVPDIYLGLSGGFLENFDAAYAGDVRTMELSNMKAKAKDSSDWVAAESVIVMLNSSLGIEDYVGSANFGTDGASFWAITSGVDGLGRTHEAQEKFELEAGDLSSPY